MPFSWCTCDVCKIRRTLTCNREAGRHATPLASLQPIPRLSPASLLLAIVAFLFAKKSKDGGIPKKSKGLGFRV